MLSGGNSGGKYAARSDCVMETNHMEMDVGGFTPFAEIGPGTLFAAPLLGSLRLCIRAESSGGGGHVAFVAVIGPVLEEHKGLPGLINARDYNIDAGFIVGKTSVSPDLLSITENAQIKAGAVVIAGVDGYLIVKLNESLRAVRLSNGAIISGGDIPSPFVVVPRWSIFRAIPFAPPRPIFVFGTNKLTL
jgi:hypothetical protein